MSQDPTPYAGMKTETPRTDAAEDNGHSCSKAVDSDFARQLERELAAKTEELQRVQAEAAAMRNALDECVSDIDFWSGKLADEWPNFDGQLYGSMQRGKDALSTTAGADLLAELEGLREHAERLADAFTEVLSKGGCGYRTIDSLASESLADFRELTTETKEKQP